MSNIPKVEAFLETLRANGPETPGNAPPTPELLKTLKLPDNCRIADDDGMVFAVIGPEAMRSKPSVPEPSEADKPRSISKLFERWGLPENCTDVTAERVGKMTGIVGPAKAPRSPAPPTPEPPEGA